MKQEAEGSGGHVWQLKVFVTDHSAGCERIARHREKCHVTLHAFTM